MADFAQGMHVFFFSHGAVQLVPVWESKSIHQSPEKRIFKDSLTQAGITLNAYFMHLTNLWSHSHLTSILCAVHKGLGQFTCTQDRLASSYTASPSLFSMPRALHSSAALHTKQHISLTNTEDWENTMFSAVFLRTLQERQQACKTAWRSHLESWKEPSGELIASWNPLYACRSGIKSGQSPLSSTFLCVFVKKEVVK